MNISVVTGTVLQPKRGCPGTRGTGTINGNTVLDTEETGNYVMTAFLDKQLEGLMVSRFNGLLMLIFFPNKALRVLGSWYEKNKEQEDEIRPHAV